MRCKLVQALHYQITILLLGISVSCIFGARMNTLFDGLLSSNNQRERIVRGHGFLRNVVCDVKRQRFAVCTVADEFDISITSKEQRHDLVVIVDPAVAFFPLKHYYTINNVHDFNCRSDKAESTDLVTVLEARG